MMAQDALVDPYPAAGSESTTSGRWPLRACASAVADPMIPAPIMMES
jgi:hypothetical protein